MTVTINGTTGIDKIQSGVVTSANLASGVPTRAQLPAGTVLQVVQAVYSTQTASTSTTQATTGLSASITPTSSTNKILVLVSNPMRSSNGSVYGIRMKLTRNGSEIFTPMNVWSYSGPSTSSFDKSYLASFNYLDSPSTTSATTYTMTFAKAFNESYTVYAQIDNDSATITLMEIAA